MSKIRKFTTKELKKLAAGFSFGKPDPIIVPACEKSEGFLTKKEFLTICTWKSERQKTRQKGNSADFIKKITAVAFSEGRTERERIKTLTTLFGVGYPVASALLHFGYDPSRYTIIDYRALWSLYGLGQGKYYYSSSFWEKYVNDCRELAKKHNISLRTLDKALWTYSKENQKERLDEED